jgi:FkbM family methyltransferase
LYGAFTEYCSLNVEQRSVLDVGASIGDTAIYFSIRANRVIAVEPYAFAFRFLKTNILANNKDMHAISYANQFITGRIVAFVNYPNYLELFNDTEAIYTGTNSSQTLVENFIS